MTKEAEIETERYLFILSSPPPPTRRSDYSMRVPKERDVESRR
ncbi:MAG: hypothetical protein WC483_01185 [Candidatus Paceibacterota bacterium]